MEIKIGCLENIKAGNSGKTLFVKGKVYTGTIAGEKAPSVLAKDEFGALQNLASPNDKFFKKHFKVIEGADSNE